MRMVGPPFTANAERIGIMVSEILISPQFQMSMLLLIALGGYILASRIGQSAVIGEILLGIVFGPSLLHIVNYTPFVKELANLGAIILLFVIGLDFELKEILKPKYFIIALVGVIVPWIGGFFLMLALNYNGVESMFVGTALTATSIAITANVLKEMGKLDTEAGKAIIGAAVIDDVLGLIALSATVSLSNGSFSAISLLILLGKSVLFFAVGGAAGYFVFKKLIRVVDERRVGKKHPETPFILSMAIALAYAAVAEWIGLSAIVGAFLAGASIGKIKLKHGKDYQEGSEYLRVIFSAIFFVSLGVIADLRMLTWPIVVLILVLTLVAVVTKIIGCGVPALLTGMSPRESLTVGLGMIPRGEVAMIVALIGLEKKVIEQNVYVAVILMSLLSTVIVPFFLKLTLKEKKPAALVQKDS
jgi:Kef-type K+ transport system membrane component KefB